MYSYSLHLLSQFYREMPERIIAVGDIHGCSQALDALLDAIGPTSNDTIVTLGDYVDRGNDSKGVIDRLLDLKSRCKLIPLMGNHEEMMLSVVLDGVSPYRWLEYGGVDTLDSYGFSGDMRVIPEEHLQFFQEMYDFYETEQHFFVHANYDPELPLEDQSEHMLRWLKLSESVPGPHFNGKRAILGHTHDRGGEIFSLAHLTCIDTYCYGGGWLTALDVQSGKIWQSNRGGNLR